MNYFIFVFENERFLTKRAADSSIKRIRELEIREFRIVVDFDVFLQVICV